ncbi:hypothetical protein M752DRAFT_166306 [Aspergillus phoenicis ATCC 13157]|uniref:Uncharacterized protein n=1 Tax=Aspergillus phoenicis ATCC 13157 TaxID=1353007 RepID=A0A370PM95_ASPPH|nr:hypothetical protein M752DRAFT_166306 [Aspergillus phoenicis ATCC 13157]
MCVVLLSMRKWSHRAGPSNAVRVSFCGMSVDASLPGVPLCLASVLIVDTQSGRKVLPSFNTTTVSPQPQRSEAD